MRRSLSLSFKVSAWALLALVLLNGSASAKIRVIQSSTPGLEANSTLSETEIVDVPKDAVVVVLQTPECRALEIKGPYRGTIADYLQQRRGFWERAHALWDRITGGAADKSGSPSGATRGVILKKECD
ncbi:MAG TPA: hypothetical protein VE986_08510 [Hyphomicrobiales bacterium]|nr:hypothetical protein [Hyphomicrobiales bacterium]